MACFLYLCWATTEPSKSHQPLPRDMHSSLSKCEITRCSTSKLGNQLYFRYFHPSYLCIIFELNERNIPRACYAAIYTCQYCSIIYFGNDHHLPLDELLIRLINNRKPSIIYIILTTCHET